MGKIKNSYSVVATGGFIDEGEGVVSFPNGLTITDDTTQRNGTRYDINSMNLGDYGNQLTADHEDKLMSLIGRTEGVKKDGNRITVDRIVYAIKQNPYAQIAYDLLVGGFSRSFSIETLGRLDADTGVYFDAELCGLSQVVTPNNYNANVNMFNDIVHNSLEKAKAEGLKVDGLEEKLVIAQTEENMAKDTKISDTTEEFVDVKVNSTEEVEEVEKVEAPEVEATEVEVPSKEDDIVADEEKLTEDETDKNAHLDEEENKDTIEQIEVDDKAEPTSPVADEHVEVEAEVEGEDREIDQKTEVEEVEVDKEVDEVETTEVKIENNAEVEKEEETTEEVTSEEETEEVVEEKTENKKEINMTKEEVQALIDGAVQNALDSKVEEPKFKEAPVSKETSIKNQFALAVASTRDLNVEAQNKLREINQANYDALVEAGKVENSIKLEDLGNLVMGPDVLTEVQGKLNSYTALLNATEWRETNALKFAWLSRGETVDMQNVSIGYSGGRVSGPIDDDALLKPYGEPTFAPHDDELEELAYVTAVALATIKFAAVDIMADIAKQFTHDYDKKRAQLVIARLQQAVNTTGVTVAYGGSTADFAEAVAEAADSTTVGSMIMSNKTKAAILRAAIAEENFGLVTELNQGTIYGTPYILVPSDLLPTLGTTETRTFMVHGEPVVVTVPIFYAEMSAFTGRISGGLSYDVDGRASYEVNGTVRSAFQRNEVVVRGSFFRGGVVTEPELVSAITNVES